MTTMADIIRDVETLSGHPLNVDEGVQHGEASDPVTRVMVAWMATPDALEAAGQSGYQGLICHESLYYPYDVVNSKQPPLNWQDWKVNRQRRELLERYKLTCLRVHGSADEICILDSFAEQLELGFPVLGKGLDKVYEIPECSLGELVESVKRRLGMAAVRVAGGTDMQRKVKRVGLPWGGLGLFVNVGYQQKLVELGCDVFIAGESDNYGFRFAVESGIPMIETSHEISENAGLRLFTNLLAQTCPSVQFHFFENDCIWKVE